MTKTLMLLALCQGLAACAPMPLDGKRVPDFPSKKARLDCSNNCKIDVFARIDDSGKCEVMPEYKEVFVPAGETPKMTWRIQSLMPPSDYDFKFEFVPKATPPLYGIAIVNATTRDFDDPGYPMSSGRLDKEKFEWKNKHLQRLTFEYVINVVKRPRNEDEWSRCGPIDPVIIND